jgi:hypothetical protein
MMKRHVLVDGLIYGGGGGEAVEVAGAVVPVHCLVVDVLFVGDVALGVEVTAEGLIAEAGVVGEAARVASAVVHLLVGEVVSQFEHPRLPVQIVHNLGRLQRGAQRCCR